MISDISLSLTYFTVHCNDLVHLCFCQWDYLILFYEWGVFHCLAVSLHLHFSASGLVDWFSLSAVINSAALNIGVHESFQIMIFFRIWAQEWDFWIICYQCVEYFKEPPCCFPQWLHPFTPHQECRKIPFCLQPLQYLFLVDLSDDGHSDHGEVIFQCCFDWHWFDN